MGFVILVSAVLAAFVTAIGLLAFRRHSRRVLIVGEISLVALLGWFLHPVCTPIYDAEAATFDPPIDTRTATDMTGQLYFRERGDHWFHCKTWIARELFF